MKNFIGKALILGCLFFGIINLSAQTDSIQTAQPDSLQTKTEISTTKEPVTKTKSTSQPAKAKKSQKKSSFEARRLFFGGGIGGHISNNSLYFNIAPQVGYYVVNGKLFRLLPGISFTYQYYQTTDGFLQIDKSYPSTNVYGPGVFARIFIKNFFAHGEYQYLWYKWNQKTIQDDYLLVGAGIRFAVGRRSGLTVSVLFDVLQHDKDNDYKIYDNPVVNIGFSF